MNDVLRFTSENVSEGRKVALITVTATRGSSPATVGQMMAVLADGTTVGTIGGGASEHQTIIKAIEAITNGDATFSLSINHADSGMTCGGGMEAFGNIIGNHVGLCIFGGGHIAQSLARVATQAGFYVTVVEDRQELSTNFKSVNYIVSKPDEYEKSDPTSLADYVVICTRGHSFDTDALRYCLTKDLKYIGMIGSRAKVATLFSRLKDEGVSQAELDKIYTPVGLDIASEAPSEIAIAITAEILLIKNDGKLKHKRD